ncbi:hypothetical protein [Aureimonas psammosilenae]|uniref:hypothetical protein n=1 Tax=Aureimonas psammosilenae TaxID=2495496 RepID=UPI0012604D16|nr:hypothetical protein [Aureimonas psammosilenae]
MTTPTTISLHPSRLGQIKMISHNLGIGIAETIEHLIGEKIRAGTIPDTTPGVTLEPEGALLAVTIGNATIRLTFAEVDHLADQFGIIVGAEERTAGYKLPLVHGGYWLVGRVGRGFMIVITDTAGHAAKFTATRAMLYDLGRQMFNASIAGIETLKEPEPEPVV